MFAGLERHRPRALWLTSVACSTIYIRPNYGAVNPQKIMREMEISARDLGPHLPRDSAPTARLGSGRSVNRVLDNERKSASIFRIFTIRQSLGLNKHPSRLVIREPERE